MGLLGDRIWSMGLFSRGPEYVSLLPTVLQAQVWVYSCGCLHGCLVCRSRGGCRNRREVNSRGKKESLGTGRKRPDWGYETGRWGPSLGAEPLGMRKEGSWVGGEASRIYRDDPERSHSTLGVAGPWGEPEAGLSAPGSLIQAYRSCLNPTATWGANGRGRCGWGWP